MGRNLTSEPRKLLGIDVINILLVGAKLGGYNAVVFVFRAVMVVFVSRAMAVVVVFMTRAAEVGACRLESLFHFLCTTGDVNVKKIYQQISNGRKF